MLGDIQPQYYAHQDVTANYCYDYSPKSKINWPCPVITVTCNEISNQKL